MEVTSRYSATGGLEHIGNYYPEAAKIVNGRSYG